jgi:hypothetical protein
MSRTSLDGLGFALGVFMSAMPLSFPHGEPNAGAMALGREGLALLGAGPCVHRAYIVKTEISPSLSVMPLADTFLPTS